MAYARAVAIHIADEYAADFDGGVGLAVNGDGVEHGLTDDHLERLFAADYFADQRRSGQSAERNAPMSRGAFSTVVTPIAVPPRR